MEHAYESGCFFETGIYRPPSEGGSYSLLLRFTRNCPWNKCTFCSMYKEEKFSIRSVEEIKGDIDAIAALCDELKAISWSLGYTGEINKPVIIEMINRAPILNTSQGFIMVVNWLIVGGRTAFLQDGNSPEMRTERLVEVLKYLRQKFPSLERVTSYARSKTLARKSLDELKAIYEAGLDRLHVGLETGDDELLTIVKKGVTGQEHIEGGRKAMEAGFQLSEYWMPGLGGKELWEQHARNTARVLTAINPHYIRSRPFVPSPGSPIYDSFASGEFHLLNGEEHLTELKLMIEELDVTSKVCFDHAGNYWRNRKGSLLFTQDYEGYAFPDQKQRVLALIEEGLEAQKTAPHNTELTRML
ncbi:MAG: radical SAM protein [Deltaproteobacteria bacterium]|nr:radical SAM protein [Deltaproteobacteria bacterium]